ncbi:hypothetical protein OF83DRAFT_1081058 [Amylostereum chailletii]|nr:hypothetical protein OF83DRAFT_1081058 [Amylostereum chailletii]
MPITLPLAVNYLKNKPNLHFIRTQTTSVIELDRNIRHELADSAFADVPKLIESVFSGPRIDNAVNDIYDTLTKSKTYIPRSKRGGHEGRWAALPVMPGSEKEIYEPLVDVLNAISTQVKDPEMPIVWLNKHNSWMQFDFKGRLLPDIVALCLEQGTNVEEYLSDLKEGPKYEAWWRLVHTPLEVKKDLGYVPSILQTFKYGRQTLKEQPDRRFVFTLLFTRSEIMFWLLDRSGALGSELVDIHANPKTLIRIVVGLMTNSPSDLGWDPTMQQYIDGERKPAYNIPRTMKSKYHVAHERKWSVMMPKPKPHYSTDAESKFKPAPVVADPDAEMEEFILHHDDGNPTKVGGVAEVYSSGIVCVDRQEDSTVNLIRKSLPQPDTEPLVLNGVTTDNTRYIASSTKGERNHPRDRIHSRLVLSSSGWPLVKFKCLPELFGALSDAVAGHEHLCRRGVLHRDMSPGNILVTGLEAPNRGIIIDLDYGIEYPRTEEAKDDDELSGTMHFMSGELLGDMVYRLAMPKENSASEDESGSDDEIVLLDDEPDDPSKTSLVATSGVEHAPHHDLEAVFWTLCYLCISREGPGVARITWPEGEQRGAVLNVLSSYFYEEIAGTIASKKAFLLASPELFESTILASFAPYFHHCKHFVLFLYNKLRRAYKKQSFDKLHKVFRVTFQRATQSRLIQEWHSKNETHKKMEEQEEKRREDQKGRFDSPHKVEAALPKPKPKPKAKGKGKRTREDSPERGAAGPAPSASRKLKRQKSDSTDSEALSSPSSRAAKNRAGLKLKAAMREEAPSPTQGPGTRSKKSSASSSQKPVSRPLRRQRKR